MFLKYFKDLLIIIEITFCPEHIFFLVNGPFDCLQNWMAYWMQNLSGDIVQLRLVLSNVRQTMKSILPTAKLTKA